MSVTETLDALGSWDLELAEDTPDYVLAQLGYFGHVAIVDGPVDVVAAGNGVLAGARYVGVCREKGKPGSYTRGGSGLLFWLGDEDGKGHVILTEISLTNATLAQSVTALLPPTVTLGTVYPQADPAARYTGKHVFQPRRDALGIVCDAFGAELRVNNDFTVDVGTPAQLYDTTLPLTSKPSPIIVRRGAGSDVDMVAVGGHVETEGAVYDYSTDIQLLGQTVGTGTDPGTVFATGSASAPSVPYKDPQGNPVKTIRLISESGETTGSVAARAQLQLNRFNRETTAVKVTAEDFETEGSFSVGDSTYVYDPDSGIVNPANEVLFHGQVLHPDAVRVSSQTWPLVEGMTVAWRTDAGVWVDLTPWVVWETASSHELTVGDLPKTLTRPSSGVQDRVDAARGDASIPKPPTGLTLATSSAVNPKGTDSAIITVSWTAPTQNTDNTALVDFDHFEVQYRPAFRAPLWQSNAFTEGTSVDLPVVAALGYDAQARAVDKAGNPSAWTSTASIVSAADSTAPAAPSDPVVTPYLGILRVYWDGKTNTGAAMPADFNRVDVHMGTTAGFTASATTLVSSLSAAGYAHVQAPYGSARYARLIAYDHNGNPSAASGTVAGTAVQAGDGDIAALSVGKLTAGIMTADVTISGRFATALTGARREMNALGFQAFDASNALTINLDGVNNLLTGKFQTALTGRRIVMGASGNTGVINFYAPDDTATELGSFTGGAGNEVIRMGVPTAGTSQFWNKHQIQSNGSIFSWSAIHEIVVGGDGPETSKGFYVAWATGRGTPTNDTVPSVTRMRISADDESHYGPGGDLRMLLKGTGGDFGSGINQFYVGSTNLYGWIEMRNGAGGSGYVVSMYQKFLTPPTPGGVTYGAVLSYGVNDNGTNSGLEVRNVSNSGFEAIKASAFLVNSSRLGKENIRDFAEPAMDMLRTVKAKSFRRKGGGRSTRTTVTIDAEGTTRDVEITTGVTADELGFVAEELPPEVVMPAVRPEDGPSFSATALLALVVNGLNELDERLDALERKGIAA